VMAFRGSTKQAGCSSTDRGGGKRWAANQRLQSSSASRLTRQTRKIAATRSHKRARGNVVSKGGIRPYWYWLARPQGPNFRAARVRHSGQNLRPNPRIAP